MTRIPGRKIFLHRDATFVRQQQCYHVFHVITESCASYRRQWNRWTAQVKIFLLIVTWWRYGNWTHGFTIQGSHCRASLWIDCGATGAFQLHSIISRGGKLLWWHHWSTGIF